MKKLLIVIFAIGMIIGLANISFANPGSPFDVTCDYNTSDLNCTAAGAPDYTAPDYDLYFDAGSYIFSIDDGYWNTTNFPLQYSWSIYVEIGGVYVGTIGDGLFYNSVTDVNNARNSGAGLMANQLTINHSGGNILFYTAADFPRSKEGTVSIAYSVVPEPLSSALFIIGGVVLGGRSYMNRKKAKARI